MAKEKRRTLKRRIAQVCMFLYDILLTVFSATASLWLVRRLGGAEFSFTPTVMAWVAGNILLSICVFLALRLYHRISTSVGFMEMGAIVVSAFIIFLANFLFVLFWGRTHGVSFWTIGLQSVALWFGVSAARFSGRFYRAFRIRWRYYFTQKTQVMIVGFNNDAFTLLRTIIEDEKNPYKVACIVDDNEEYLEKHVYDVRVVGTTYEAQEIVKKYQIKEIFVAIPSQSAQVKSGVLKRLQECGVPLKLLPELSKMTGGEISVSKLRNVEIEDLLGRPQVNTQLEEIIGYIKGKTVLVTGGGGSIGSELCRQIAAHSPKELIILDVYENNIYDIEQELKRRYPTLKLLSLVASIRGSRKMDDVFKKYRPQIVFNAAAHKHVPLMETSPNEAVKNNVFGTLHVARAADKYGAETFVQISTDKAVNPTNVMGATKRICEMIIQTLGRHSKNTKFVAVRLGNVLGSNGSVIPLFKKQIAEGGPVTITHKDIIRYFMTIPEAVSLVLQAGAYAKGGQIFVLDMGEPVKIYDLAYNIIKLSGLEPGEDIEIKCTGLRLGEKLYEERLMAEEGLQKTANGLINIAQPIPVDEDVFWDAIGNLYEAAYAETEEMKEWVKKLVPTYTIDTRPSVAVEFIQKATTDEEDDLNDEKAAVGE